MSMVMIWDDAEDDCYDDYDATDYGCGIPGCSCMTDTLNSQDDEEKDED